MAASKSQLVTVNLIELGTTISKGIQLGNEELLKVITIQSEKRHDLIQTVQSVVEKVYNLDAEVKLSKGMLVSLIGMGDGSTGSVPRIESDMRSLKNDMATTKSEMTEVKSEMTKMGADVKALLNIKAEFKGGAVVSKWVVTTCITIILSMIAIAAKILFK